MIKKKVWVFLQAGQEAQLIQHRLYITFHTDSNNFIAVSFITSNMWSSNN